MSKVYEHTVSDCFRCPFRDSMVCGHKRGQRVICDYTGIPKGCPLRRRSTVVRLDARMLKSGKRN